MSYCDPDDLVPHLGGGLDPARAQELCDAATEHVDSVCGQSFPDPPPVGVKLAAIQVAVRFARSGDAPFGVLQALGENPAYVRAPIPDLDVMLLGYRVSWGIA